MTISIMLNGLTMRSICNLNFYSKARIPYTELMSISHRDTLIAFADGIIDFKIFSANWTTITVNMIFRYPMLLHPVY
jgi:hypothetical protein